MGNDLRFTIPTNGNELVTKFLSIREEGPQRLLLAAIKLGSEQPGRGELVRLLNVLRTDSRTRETVARLESTRYVEPKKSKAERQQERLQISRKGRPLS